MRSFIVVLLFFLYVDCVAQQGLAIVHVNVVNVTMPNDLSRDQTVIVTAGRIVRIGQAANTKVPAGFTIIEGNGKFLIPGLWDMHTHLSYYGAEAFPLLIAHGVTSVRDMGSDRELVDQWRADIKAGKMKGPMIFFPDSLVDDLKDTRITEVSNPGGGSIEHAQKLPGASDPEIAKIKAGKRYFDPILVTGVTPLVTKLHKARVPLLTGTDFAKKDAGAVPGKDLHRELGLLVKAGLTPGEALRAATINAARCMGVENKVGSITEGLIANLVLLDDDPLKDIANTRKISKIILNGRVQ